jgi:hypothetical protein
MPPASRSPDLRSDAAGLLRRWSKEAGRVRARARPASIRCLVIGLASGTAEAAPRDALTDGRTAYQYAMEQTNDPTERKAAFARAAIALAEAVRAHPEQPELVTDWGNAALGSGDVATATLAYRRALVLDGSNTRARHNLAWLRGKLPETFSRARAAGATDTLLFFHRWPCAPAARRRLHRARDPAARPWSGRGAAFAAPRASRRRVDRDARIDPAEDRHR